MATIKNPSMEQIEKALSLVAPSNVITDSRYAMTADGAAFLTSDDSCSTLAVGVNRIRAIRHIMVYGGKTATVTHVLVGIDMYPKQNIINREYIAVPANEIPKHFENMETTIFEL